MRPTVQTLWCLAITLLLGISTLFNKQLLWYWAALVGFLSLMLCFDALSALLRRNKLHGERHVNDTLSLGAWHKVELHLSNPQGAREKIDVVDHTPTSFRSDSTVLKLSLPANGEHTLEYRIQPTERGQHEFHRIQVRRYSPWSFWTSTNYLGEPLQTRVFPNFTAITKYMLRGADSMQSVAASHIHQRRGEGLEFHQLREYRVGDTFRQIDWKASARSQKLITKEFQEERDQQVIFLIDSGRRMLSRDGDLSHFDHVLNTVLLLGYIALRQGDAVGYMTCEPDPQWMRATKGRSTINTLSRNLYDLQPRSDATDYWQAATELAKRQRRRAMIILVTNIRDEDSEELRKAINLLKQRHLLVIASLVENAVENTLEKDVDSFSEAIDFAATQDYLQHRHKVHQSMRRGGVFVHDTNCTALPNVLTEQYLAIKRAGLL